MTLAGLGTASCRHAHNLNCMQNGCNITAFLPIHCPLPPFGHLLFPETTHLGLLNECRAGGHVQRALGRGTRSERACVLCGHKSGHLSGAYHQRYSQPSTYHLEEARHQEKALHGDYPHPSPGFRSLTLLCTSYSCITMLHQQAHIYFIKTAWLENKGRAPSLCITTSISTDPVYLRRFIETMPHKEEAITVLRAMHFEPSAAGSKYRGCLDMRAPCPHRQLGTHFYDL